MGATWSQINMPIIERVNFTLSCDFFNVLNANTITAFGSDNFGTATFTVPANILLGRLPRVGIQLKW